MNKKSKLILALQQVEGISKLVKGNSYEKFIVQHLAPIHAELNRQLSNEKNGKKLITSLTEDACIAASRFYLKFKQDEKNGLVTETKTYSGEVGGKL